MGKRILPALKYSERKKSRKWKNYKCFAVSVPFWRRHTIESRKLFILLHIFFFFRLYIWKRSIFPKSDSDIIIIFHQKIYNINKKTKNISCDCDSSDHTNLHVFEWIMEYSTEAYDGYNNVSTTPTEYRKFCSYFIPSVCFIQLFVRFSVIPLEHWQRKKELIFDIRVWTRSRAIEYNNQIIFLSFISSLNWKTTKTTMKKRQMMTFKIMSKINQIKVYSIYFPMR